MKPTPHILMLRVFLPFAAGYFLSYMYRVVNAVIAPDLIVETGIGPSALGLLTATYFITFASFQLPLGVLLDRYGPRRMEALLLLFAALGAFVFSRADSLSGLIIGRALIGFGVSACLMAAFKAYTTWFPRENWPIINGLQMASGGFGALAATSPVELMLGVTDWRGVFLLLTILTLMVAAAVFLIVPEKDEGNRAEPLSKQLSGVKEVFTSPDFLRTAPVTAMSQAAFLSIQGLWTGPWLKDVAQFDRPGVAAVLFWIAVAMIAGFVLLGAAAARLKRSGVSIMTTAVLGMGLFMVAQLLVLCGPIEWTMPIWLGFGFFGTSGILAYAAMSQIFPVHLSGRVTTALNLLVFITAFAGQWAIGAIIGIWPVESDGGYANQGYTAAFSLVLLAQVVSLAWFFLAGRCMRNRLGDAERSQQLKP